jgi:hypothetical protein
MMGVLRAWCLAGLFVFEAETIARTPAATEVGQVGWSEPTPEDRGPKLRGPETQATKVVSPFTPSSHNVGLDLGQVILMGSLAKFNDNLGVQLHYTYGVSDLFGFDAMIGYSEHSNGELGLSSFLAGIRSNLAWFDKVVPYASLGLGFFRVAYTRNALTPYGSLVEIKDPIAQLLFGLHAGIGINLDINPNFYFGASFRPHLTFGARQRVMDTDIGFGGTYLSFLLETGLTF